VKNKGKDEENIAEGTARSAGTAAAAESTTTRQLCAVDGANEDEAGEAQQEAAKIRRTKQKTAEQCCGGF
jgi:hypothetical protein